MSDQERLFSKRRAPPAAQAAELPPSMRTPSGTSLNSDDATGTEVVQLSSEPARVKRRGEDELDLPSKSSLKPSSAGRGSPGGETWKSIILSRPTCLAVSN